MFFRCFPGCFFSAGKNKYTLIFVLILFFSTHLCFAGSFSMEEIIQRTGAEFTWDFYRHTGMLDNGSTAVVFMSGRPGGSWIIKNGKELIKGGTILEENGRLTFSEEAARAIFSAFGVDHSDDSGYRLTTILIDPGHGGRDSGAGRSWPVDGTIFPLTEKDIVLEISLRLEESLKKTFPDKNIILTRTSDMYPTLEERVALANGIKLGPMEGMIYISIHANASLNRKAEGYEVWYLPEDYRRTVVDSDKLNGNSEIAPIVNTLWEEEFTHESSRLADMILDGFRKNLGQEIPDRGKQEESWFVVRNARMASVLVEVGFVTNSSEAQRMRSPEYLSRIAGSIYNGIVNFVHYFESKETAF